MTRDHRYHSLRVTRVVAETTDASSFVFDVPDDLQPTFAYEPGQFCDIRAVVDGLPYIRCYSMSSAPALDEPLQVTVKRVPGGVVSNWMIDQVRPGDVLELSPPAGFFQLKGSGDVVAFAAGRGITPIFSLLKTSLMCTTRRVRLLYANRDRESIIFGAPIDDLVHRHGDRITAMHHLDVEHGFVAADDVRAAMAGTEDAEIYVCGPAPFMDVVERTLVSDGVDQSRIHIERFTPAEAATPVTPADVSKADGRRVTIELEGRTEVTEHRAGTTILQTARQLGLSPPYSCESGSCATCMARVVDGAVLMPVNNALTPDEVDEGWILTCQSVPTTPTVHVVYGYD